MSEEFEILLEKLALPAVIEEAFTKVRTDFTNEEMKTLCAGGQNAKDLVREKLEQVKFRKRRCVKLMRREEVPCEIPLSIGKLDLVLGWLESERFHSWSQQSTEEKQS